MARRTDSLTILRWVLSISILGATAPVFWKWIDPTSYGQMTSGGSTDVILNYGGYSLLVWWQRIAGILIDALPQLFLVYALICLWRLTRLLDAGDWFGQASEDNCRRAGIAMLWFVLANWLHDTLMILMITANRGPGKHELAIGISNYDILTLIPALMALVIARMVALARAQRDELNEIV